MHYIKVDPGHVVCARRLLTAFYQSKDNPSGNRGILGIDLTSDVLKFGDYRILPNE